MIEWFFILLFGHCLADTTFQTQVMARGKNRNNPIDLTRVPVGQKPVRLWSMWLTHHSMIHGGVVWLLTSNVYLGMIEAISHWIIDFFKCDGKYSPNVDQSLHLIMKVFYCIFLLSNESCNSLLQGGISI
jgi:hypothetical protein